MASTKPIDHPAPGAVGMRGDPLMERWKILSGLMSSFATMGTMKHEHKLLMGNDVDMGKILEVGSEVDDAAGRESLRWRIDQRF